MMRRMTLAIARLGQVFDELDFTRLQGLAQFIGDQILQRFAQIIIGLRVGREDAEAHHALAFQFIGHADDGRFADEDVRHEDRFHFRRAEAFARHFDRVIRSTEDVPQAIVIDRGPIAMHPHVREAAPIGFDVPIGIAPEAARHADPRLADHQLADLLRAPIGLLHRRRPRPCRAAAR